MNQNNGLQFYIRYHVKMCKFIINNLFFVYIFVFSYVFFHSRKMWFWHGNKNVNLCKKEKRLLNHT